MIKTRKIVKDSETGNYVGMFGRGNANWIYGLDAFAQIITHQIMTIKGELKTKTDYGVSWFEKENQGRTKTLFDTQIKRIIVENSFVLQVNKFESNIDIDKNSYSLYTEITTTDGTIEVII